MKYKLLLSIIACTLFVGCTTTPSRNTIIASTEPIAWVLNSLADTTQTTIVTLVDSTQISAEMYEPTARKLAEVQGAAAFFSTTLLDYEQILSTRLTATKTIDLSYGINLLHGACCHSAHHATHSHNHTHGTDPHIWLSTKNMRKIIHTAAAELDSLGLLKPRTLDSLLSVIDTLEQTINSAKSGSKSTAFTIVHPSLGYFARDNGLLQIALEKDGKEPSMRTISEAIEEMKTHGVEVVLCNNTTTDKAAEMVANQTGATIVGFNPLQRNWPAEIEKVAFAIYGTTR